MNKDLRSRARVPFGYKIVDGFAVIDPEEASVLKEFFARFLDGESMAFAAREAGFPSSPATYSHYFYKKELAGTDYYPAIVSEGYQKELIKEYEKRKGRRRQSAPCHTRREVRIYTDFYMAEMPDVLPEDPEAYVKAIYQRIQPEK